MSKNVDQRFPETLDDWNVLFYPQLKDIQFTVIEE